MDESAIPSVLVVDDDDVDRMVMRRLFRAQGMLLEATTARAGLEVAKRHNPSLILIGNQLPDTDGFDLLGRIKSCGLTASVYLVGNRVDETERQRAVASGATDFITKASLDGPLARLILDTVRSQLRAR